MGALTSNNSNSYLCSRSNIYF